MVSPPHVLNRDFLEGLERLLTEAEEAVQSTKTSEQRRADAEKQKVEDIIKDAAESSGLPIV